MAGDVDRIAEVILSHQTRYGIRDMKLHCICGWSVDKVAGQPQLPQHVAEQLTAAGIGHVPTALHQAADDMSAEGRDTFWRDDSPFHGQGRFWTRNQADWLRARADRAGGTE